MAATSPRRVAVPLVALLLCAAEAPAQWLTHGDAVGSLTHDSALVWARTSSAALVSVRYATSPALAGALETPQVGTAPGTDWIAKIRLTGLQPATRYWYVSRVADPAFPNTGVLGATGTFRTPAAPG